jgi:hypothetical protein
MKNEATFKIQRTRKKLKLQKMIIWNLNKKRTNYNMETS